MKLKIRKVGNSLGIILPEKITNDLQVREGDAIYAVEVEHGVKLTAYDPDFDKTMAAYDKFSKRYRNALRELAK